MPSGGSGNNAICYQRAVNFLSCVLAILYFPTECHKTKAGMSGPHRNQGIDQTKVPHARAVVVREVHCFFAFLSVLEPPHHVCYIPARALV